MDREQFSLVRPTNHQPAGRLTSLWNAHGCSVGWVVEVRESVRLNPLICPTSIGRMNEDKNLHSRTLFLDQQKGVGSSFDEQTEGSRVLTSRVKVKVMSHDHESWFMMSQPTTDYTASCSRGGKVLKNVLFANSSGIGNGQGKWPERLLPQQ